MTDEGRCRKIKADDISCTISIGKTQTGCEYFGTSDALDHVLSPDLFLMREGVWPQRAQVWKCRLSEGGQEGATVLPETWKLELE